MNKEFNFLNIISKNLNDSSFLGNDCAYLDEYSLAVSQDTLIEDVHFSFLYMNANEIAQKAMLVNISDILASGAKPKYVTISLSGKLDEHLVNNFYLGINEIAREYDIKIIGGDLTKANKLIVSITVFGDYKNRQVSKRNNAKENYIVAVMGEFGSSAKGLKELKEGLKESYFIDYHKKPKLYPKISQMIAKNAAKPYAMMDSSDSLVDCLIQISNKSNVQINIDYNLIPKKINDRNLVLYGGEDYSLVCCLDEEDFKKIPELIKIGYCSNGSGVFVDNNEIEYKGFKHFE